jgi:hypothetical protein
METQKCNKRTSALGYALALYIVNGEIYDDVPEGEANYDELARDIWPKRMMKLVEMASKVVKEDLYF